MDNKKFKLWNRLTAVLMLVISAVVYLLTIEPTASFWDCGEFIASSYKLEVGHPPGNPVFQLFARFFSMFTGPENAAMAVNALSAICSAFTIFFLYLTIVFFAKRLIKPLQDGTYSIGRAIAIFGSGAVGALVYTFTDTFWFSAVEGEVYAMSSLITALVFWAMTKWYEQADQPHANRWIVLISFMMGLSIGIHLLNLLAIPALVFLFYYKKRENGHYSMLEYIKIFLVSVVILAVVLYGVIPYLPRIAAYFDLFFVNTLGLPFNTGAAFFMLVLLALCFWGIYSTMKAKKVLLNMIMLCFTMIVIGFSLFTIVIIRSSAKTPTNEYQPDNPFTLVRYLGREQYGSNPLVYGEYFDADYELEETEYWAPMGDVYVKAKGPVDPVYKSEDKMIFPRMWSSSPSHIDVYTSYMTDTPAVESIDDRGNPNYRKPTFRENLYYFFDYQMNWMYWRYFMWNFAGRQNDIHSPSPGDPFVGNWESGISIVDKWRLGDQSDAPDYLKNNKGKNHYYMLPLLLGIIGIFFQSVRDKRGCWVTFLMFFMTGIAIVLYLNQPPLQVRERDYAYAGSFYSFSIWIGLAVAAVYSGIKAYVTMNKRTSMVTASAVTAAMLGVPALMAVENWDDHDRSNRYTAVEMAKNYLNSVGKNGILVTHGDNDTFPLWYAQEVENVRPDVRIANTSLLGTDWHIDQMKWAMNESAPLDLSLDQETYLYGTNDMMYIEEVKKDSVWSREDLIAHLSDKKNTLMLVEFSIVKSAREKYGPLELIVAHRTDCDLRTSVAMDNELIGYSKQIGGVSAREIQIEGSKNLGMYLPCRSFKMPVNKENVIKYGILDKKYEDRIPEEIVLTISKGKGYISKPELFMVDLLANYKWDRPLNLLSMGGDINVGLKDYLMYEGFSYKFVPIKNKTRSSDIGFADPDDLYYKMKNVYKWDALKRKDYFVDYQNFYTFCGVLSQRNIFLNVAKEIINDKEKDKEEINECEKKKALEMLDMCQECVPEENYPLDIHYLGFSNEYMTLEMIRLYFKLGQREKAEALVEKMVPSLLHSIEFFSKFDVASEDVDKLQDYLYWIVDLYQLEIDSLEDEVSELAEAGKDTVSLDRLAEKYLSQCHALLKYDGFKNYDAWYHLVRQSHKWGKDDKAVAVGSAFVSRLLADMKQYMDDMDSLYKRYANANASYEKAYDSYSKEASKTRPSNSRLSQLKNQVIDFKDDLEKIASSFQTTEEAYTSAEKYTKSLLGIFSELGREDLIEKFGKQLLELQDRYENQ